INFQLCLVGTSVLVSNNESANKPPPPLTTTPLFQESTCQSKYMNICSNLCSTCFVVFGENL
ncbi:hypothetical protein C0J52_12878, partial [Blattella germanica]